MSALVIAIGNRMRRDDGAAHRVLELLGGRKDLKTRAVLQLTPEIAEELQPHSVVVFVDADVMAGKVRIEAVNSLPSHSPLTHVSRPAEIVALARALFDFTGEAYTCHVPASDLSAGEGLSHQTERFAREAARMWIARVA